MSQVKVLIADDSVVYRSQIRSALSHFPWLEIIGVASNGKLALQRLMQSRVDLLILDLEMPELDGIGTLREIQKLGITTQVLVFSSISKRGAEITLEALRLGAKDFVAKPGAHVDQLMGHGQLGPTELIRQLLVPKLEALFPDHSKAKQSSSLEQRPKGFKRVHWETFRPQVVVMGSSTGGPTALERVLTQIGPSPSLPILITQHMPPLFTASLAERIERITGIPAAEGQNGELLRAGRIYIAPGNYHMSIDEQSGETVIRLEQGPLINSVRPAVDPLFSSAAQIYGPRTLGVVLTGMGHDGRDGSLAIKRAGGAVIIQDQASSVVHGMPGSVLSVGAYDEMGCLDEIAERLRSKLDVSSGARYAS